MPLLTFILKPISEFDFYLKVIQKLFLAKTKKENIFKLSKNEKYKKNIENLKSFGHQLKINEFLEIE